jgi:RluA family pseudouridine synthase
VTVRVLYRDDRLLVADKPAGLLTVPGRGDETGSLVAEVRGEAPGALAVHRLDRNTSGAVVFAIGREAHQSLNAAFAGRRVEKTYAALVRGDLAGPLRIELPLAGTRRGGMRVARPGEKGSQPAITDVAPRERFGNYTLCTCTPKTGRTHQLRVHLSSIGHPLAVDPRYGDARPLRSGDLWNGAPDPDTVVLERTPLHAVSLRIPHPGKRGWLLVESPIADDIARCLDLLRAARRES